MYERITRPGKYIVTAILVAILFAACTNAGNQAQTGFAATTGNISA